MLVLLDRDGVINEDISPNGVTSLSQLVIYPFAAQAIALLNHQGYKVAIATNQSAIGKGLMTEETLQRIHQYILDEMYRQGAVIDQMYYAPDHPGHASDRRKPGNGMLREALADFNVDATSTPMIGDTLRDLQAAASLGCPRYLVMTGKGRKTLAAGIEKVQPVIICDDLLDAVHKIILHNNHVDVH